MHPEATTVLGVEDQTDLSGSLGEKTVNNDDWDRAFTALVAENADVIVESPRLPGVKLPFGAAMLMCQGKLTPENVHIFYTEGMRLLANRVTETEEEAEEEEAEENESEVAKAEEATEEEAGQKSKAIASEEESDSANQESSAEVSGEESKETDKPSSQNIPEQDVVLDDDSTNLSNEAGPLVANSKAGEGTSPNGVSPEPLVDKASSAERLRVASEAARAPSEKQFVSRRSSALNVEPEVPEPKVKANISKPAAIQAEEAYPIPQWEVGSAARRAHLENELAPDTSLATSYEDDLYDELWQVPGEMPVSDMQEIDVAEDSVLPIGETEYSIFPLENENAVIAPEISVPVEEVEQTILLLAECIEESEAEQAETAHQLLDEIVNKLEEARTSREDGLENYEATSETEELEEELKKLFIQLFDCMGIEYSQELLESFVKLVLKEGLSESISTIKHEDEINVPQGTGTHEVIKQLLATISYIKKSVQHAYHLGKSALRLHSQKLHLELERYTAYGDSQLIVNTL